MQSKEPHAAIQTSNALIEHPYFCIVAKFNGKNELISVYKVYDVYNILVGQELKATISYSKEGSKWKLMNCVIENALLIEIGEKINKIFRMSPKLHDKLPL